MLIAAVHLEVRDASGPRFPVLAQLSHLHPPGLYHDLQNSSEFWLKIERTQLKVTRYCQIVERLNCYLQNNAALAATNGVICSGVET